LLLFSISWLVSLTYPLIEISNKSLSGRDLILLSGGIFLLFKATIELHERIEGNKQNKSNKTNSSFVWVIGQVIVIDVIFSIDSIITAIGMVSDISIMISAVMISFIVMILASNPLTKLINSRPTLVILCLGFLLMIGFSLVAEGLGFNIPKSYLYAAIAFSLSVETLNQLAQKTRSRRNNKK